MFTGHRPGKFNAESERWTKEVIRAFLVEHKPERAISGMALGVDTWAAEICVDLGIPFTAAIPCDGQDALWKPEDREKYEALIVKSSSVVIVSPGPYAAWKMHARNRWMARHALNVLAVWDGSSGGTSACLEHIIDADRTAYLKQSPSHRAQFVGHRIDLIDPKVRSSSRYWDRDILLRTSRVPKKNTVR